MDSIEMIKERRSVRKFKDEKIPRKTMEEIVELSRWSPSWANFQVARYTIVDDKNLIEKIANEGVHKFSYNMKTLENAKAITIISYVRGKSGKLDNYAISGLKESNWEMFDAGIACQTFCLASHAKGVGTCIFGIMDGDSIAKMINLPSEETIACIIACGFEDGEHAKPTARKSTSEILKFI